MLRKTSLVAVLALAGASVTSAASLPTLGPAAGSDAATAVLSNPAAGSRPVALTIRFRTELQCNQFTAVAIDVHLPSAMRIPAEIAPSAVAVMGRAPSSVTVRHATVVIMPSRLKLPICDLIGPGSVSISFATGARLGNPARAGSYAFSVVSSRGTWRGSLAVR